MVARARTTLDGAAVALLVTVRWRGGAHVVPLHAGRNRVHRARDGSGSPSMESAQWVITCGDGVAEVEDDYSTNLSLLVPRDLVPTVELGDHLRGFGLLARTAGVTELPHPNVAAPRHRYRLEAGDVLRSCYAAFVFAWR